MDIVDGVLTKTALESSHQPHIASRLVLGPYHHATVDGQDRTMYEAGLV